MDKEQLKYQIALTLLPNIGDVYAKNLVSYCGSVEAIFKESKRALLKIPSIGPKAVESIKNNVIFEKAVDEIEFIQQNNIQTLFYLDKNYPKRLKHCNDSPILLYYKGNADLNSRKILSIVGTRNATHYGKSVCKSIISDLVKHEVLVVSGLAYGIDVTAHKEAMDNGLNTVGVLGHGLDRIYPTLHKSTADSMVETGGLLTEFISKTSPERENFPKRNRIIAGMADAVIVIEAGKKGGALITADIANTYNRDVFAIPGKVNDTYSMGCNYLIKKNKADMVESVKDIEYLLGWEKQDINQKVQKTMFVDLKPEEKILVELIQNEKSVRIDDLCIKSNLSMSRTSSILLNLEMAGIVRSLPGKTYQLN